MADDFDRENTDRTFTEVNLESTRLTGLQFDQCRFVRCRFTDVRFARCRFEGCVFEDCEFVACAWPDTALREVRFERGRLMGVDWTPVRPFGFEIACVDCRMDHSVFFEVDLRHARFERCGLREADFSRADVRGVRFDDCDLTAAVFRHTRLEKTDFSGSRGCAIDVATCRVAETVVAADTALGVLESLGLRCPDLGLERR